MLGLIFGILRYVKKKKQVKVTQHLANRFTADRSSEENEGLALRSSAFASLLRWQIYLIILVDHTNFIMNL